MTVKLSVPQNEVVELKPRIMVVGVGGAGGNAVNNMINAKLGGVEFIVANTDAQALEFAQTDRRIQLGTELTQGLGAGSKPEIGRAAAEETIEELNAQLKGSHMVFIAAGMGGGTGTGAAPVVARAARDLGVLTVGVVTKPFEFEGQHRQSIADKGIEELEQYVDTLIVIPNQNLFRVANEKTTFADAFTMADDVLHSGVRGITDLMVMPGIINLDFADVRSIMSEMGKAMMGTGEGEGERRALDAAEAAIANPLLDDTSMGGAKAVLINITGGSDMTLFEVDEATNRIRSEVDDNAYIIFGSTLDESLEGKLRVSVVATGIDAENAVRRAPATLPLQTQAISRTVVPEPEEIEPQLNEAAIMEAGTYTGDDAAEEFAEVAAEITTEITAEVAEFEVRDGSAQSVNLEDASPQFSAAPSEHVSGSIPTPPVGMPRAGSDDFFMPQTAAPELQPSEPEQAPQEQVAVAHAPAPKSSGLSLFERVTGGAKQKVSMFGQGKATKQAASNNAETANAAPSTPAQPQGTPTTSVMRNQGSVAVEPTLGGLVPEERLQTSQADEDRLDIPAFLRRQAN